jgi:hypothetical protein
MAAHKEFDMGAEFAALDFHSIRREERFIRTDESASHNNKKKWPIEEKESFRWLEMMDKSVANIPGGIRVITVCDREGDMADLSPMSCLLKPKRWMSRF